MRSVSVIVVLTMVSLYSSVVGRILEADECPLEVQSRWKTGDQGTFTLTQAEFEVKIVIKIRIR